MIFPNFIHHGGASGVTGSCHELVANAEPALFMSHQK